METIIIKARTKAESKTILDFLKKKNLKASVHKELTKRDTGQYRTGRKRDTHVLGWQVEIA
ncbi:MAG TPA: hypothetical protein VIH86_14470 [Puia sp.]|jgi:hypothetical protein